MITLHAKSIRLLTTQRNFSDHVCSTKSLIIDVDSFSWQINEFEFDWLLLGLKSSIKCDSLLVECEQKWEIDNLKKI